jgi:hypothetical protein
MVEGRQTEHESSSQNLLKALRRLNLKDEAASFGGYILIVAALTLSISMLVSVGPAFQYYSLSLIRSDAPSIYGSAYNDSLIRFPHISDWLAAGFHWQFLTIAALVVVSTIRCRTARKLFAFSSLAFFFTLTANDFLFAIINSELSTGYALENIVANALGGPLLAFATVTFVAIADLSFVHVSGPTMWRQSIGALIIIIVGACSNITLFYSAEFFYRPVPVKLDVVFDYPVSGSIGRGSIKDKTPSFQLFPSSMSNSTIHWRGRTPEGTESVQWTSNSQDKFSATVELFGDCIEDRLDVSKSIKENARLFNDVNRFSVSSNPGFSSISTLDSPSMSARLVSAFGKLQTFWLDREAENQRVKITQFAPNDATISIWNHSDAFTIFINVPLFAESEKGIVSAARALQFSLNGLEYTVQSIPSGAPRDSILKCRSLPLRNILSAHLTSISEGLNYLGALIRVTKRLSPKSIYGVDDNEIKIVVGNGLVSIIQSIDDIARRHEAGTADFLNFLGNVASLDIDGGSIAIRSIDHYAAFGKFVGRFEQSGQLRFSGVAKALWREQARVNPTKWERLSWEPRLSILGIVAAALGSVAGLFLKCMKNDTTFSWLATK